MAIRRLRTRLLVWFLVAIFVGTSSNVITIYLMRPSGYVRVPTNHVARIISTRLEAIWEDRAATDAYVAEMREVTGSSLVLRRTTNGLPESVVAPQTKRLSNYIIEDGSHGYIPIASQGRLIGAVEFPENPFARMRWWRLFAGMSAAMVVLVFAAFRLARDLARPLERIASAATRFGAGDLTSRTGPLRAADEIQQVSRAFDKMADRVERMLRDQRELLAAISHELRSPLGRARVALEIGRERAEGDVAKKPLDHVEQQLVEVDAILSDLLAVTRAGLTDLRSERRRYAGWLRTHLATEQREGGVELSMSEDVEPLELAIDGPLLARAVHNLVANARAHGHPPAEPLVVHVQRAGDRLVTSVIDRGPGFAESVLPRAFDPFVRGDETRSHGAGSGLGLSLVRRIVEAHRGTVFARNREIGAEVGFELPVE